MDANVGTCHLWGLLAGVVLVAGCTVGSSSSVATTTVPATTLPTTTTVPATTGATSTTTGPEIAAERQAATKVVIQVADAGAGFTGAAHDASTDVDLGPCVDDDPVLSGTSYPTEADGPDLSDSSELAEIDIQSSVRIAPSVAAAEVSLAVIKAPGVLACLTSLLRPAPPAGVTVSRFSLALLTVPSIGDDVFAYQTTLVATDSGSTVDSTEDSLVVRTGRVLSQLSVLGINVIPTLSLVTRLATTMSARARAVSS